jgi:arginine N-succinyltransferase
MNGSPSPSLNAASISTLDSSKPFASTILFRIREVSPADCEQVLRFGRLLDSINLPTEHDKLATFIQQSRRSFGGQLQDSHQGMYLFVLEEAATQQIVGTSMLIAKHGTPECPHYYLEMATDERYSKTLNKMFRHDYLTLRHSMDGPTELGGLVVDPAFRTGLAQKISGPKGSAKIGKQLSFVRFLYLAMYPEHFEDQVLAEMLPALTEDGESLFWECYGKRVTGLSFRKADKLSVTDKEFIEALFPPIPLYLCMLPLEVQKQIGQVGRKTEGAVHLLKKVGLRFLNHVDPFDAGPFYGASVEDLVPIQQFHRYCVEVDHADVDAQQANDLLIGWEGEDGFRAARIAAQPDSGVLRCSASDAAALGLEEGLEVGTIPFL